MVHTYFIMKCSLLLWFCFRKAQGNYRKGVPLFCGYTRTYKKYTTLCEVPFLYGCTGCVNRKRVKYCRAIYVSRQILPA